MVVSAVISAIVLSPTGVLATDRVGRDPDDVAGVGDVRIVGVETFRQDGEWSFRVMVRPHDGSSLRGRGEGQIVWSLDGTGGPRRDHVIIASIDEDAGLLGCWLQAPGNVDVRIRGRETAHGVACRGSMRSTSFDRFPRFWARTELRRRDMSIVPDRAPSGREHRWYG
jgi:hypothetical protein